FYRSQDFAELLARKVIGQLQHEAAGFFDWGNERIHWSIHFGNYSSIFSFPNKKNVRTKIAPESGTFPKHRGRVNLPLLDPFPSASRLRTRRQIDFQAMIRRRRSSESC